MKQVTINIYKFDELSEAAKQTAIERFLDINVSFDWWECTYEDAKNIGLKITDFDLDRNRHANGEFIVSACEVAQNIVKYHGENCETYKTASNFLAEHSPIFADYLDDQSENYESAEFEDKMNDLEGEFLTDICECYSIILQNECEYLQSSEAIIETIKANDYDFLESGKIY